MADLSQELGICNRDGEGTITVAVTGELDLATAPQLRAHLDSVIAAGTDDVTIDLTGVSFLDSTALIILVAAHRRLAESGRQVTLLNPSELVRRVLEISRVIDVIDVRQGDPKSYAD